MADGEDRNFVVALARGLSVLRAFKAGDAWLGNQDIAARTGLPKPTVSRLTYTLTELGYLTRLDRIGKYRLAPASVGIGYTALANLGIREMARPAMQQLADEAGASVAIGSPDRLSMIYVALCTSDAPVRIRLDVGSRIPMATTAMGRAYIAGLEAPQRQRLMERIEERAGPDWSRVKDGIDDALDCHRQHGFVLSVGDWQDGVNSVGAPIVMADGTGIYSLNCGASAYMLSRERLTGEIGPQLRDVVRTVEMALNGAPGGRM
jgi:DNA-binding IclR family transcriptional regulator